MFSAAKLFEERLKEHIKRLNRYLRYIFNGHFMIALLFILVTLSVYYQQVIQTIEDPFIPTIIMAIIFGFVASYNPMQFFLKEPDKVFIIVKETAMGPYFRRTLMYNYIFQLYIVLFASVVIGPLYTQVYPENGLSKYSIIISILLILKGIQMWMNWRMLRIHHRTVRKLDVFLRGVIVTCIFYFLLTGDWLVFVYIIIFGVLIMQNMRKSKQQGGLAWDVLIENDEHRLAQFYRFVSMFAEAPQLSKRMKKRKLLTSLIEKRIPFEQRRSFDYIFRLTFIRSSDYLNMYVRLIILGSLFILFVPNILLKLIFGLLFLYMSIFQMTALYHHHETSIWLNIYPVKKEEKKKRYIVFSSNLTILQTVIFTLIFLSMKEFQLGLIMFLVGLLFNYLFHFLYVEKKLT